MNAATLLRPIRGGLLLLALVLGGLPPAPAHGQNFDCAAQDDVPEVQCQALVALYEATEGPNWTNNSGWLEAPISQWFGITVENGHVAFIDLRGNQLSGSVPPDIAALSELLFLQIDFNNLTGPILPELVQLSNLQVLGLGANELTGEIPASLSQLQDLFGIYIYENQLTGPIPPELGSLPGLRFLELFGNQLGGPIPPELGDLENLQRLRLEANALTGPIPPELGQLTNLERLFLDANQLVGAIPPALGSLPALRELALDENQLSGEIPAELGQLAALEFLDLHGNQLTGELPAELSQLANLRDLILDANQLGGAIPPALGGLAALRVILFQDNQFAGEIPTELGGLAALEVLNLAGNQLTGGVPGTVANLTRLTDLFLAGNAFTDLPDLSGLPALAVVQAEDNRLTFEDLEPNIGIATFSYAPQAPVGETRTEALDEGGALTLQLSVGGANNVYQWLRDGTPLPGATSATLAIPAAAPGHAGVYTLQVTNTLVPGLTLTSEPITVTVRANEAPTAVFTASTTTGFAPLEVTFDASATTDPDGTPAAFDWDFGDGAAGSGPIVRHTFADPGTYSVTLTVTDDDGATATATASVAVQRRQTLTILIRALLEQVLGLTQPRVFQLVALPGAVDLPLAEALPGTAGDDWRAYRLGDDEAPGGLAPYDASDAFRFRPGAGFWIRSETPWRIERTVPAAALDADGAIAIPLRAGFNILSNPLEVDVDWADVVRFNGLPASAALFAYEEGSFHRADVFRSALARGEAFYFENTEGRPHLRIPFPRLAPLPEVTLPEDAPAEPPTQRLRLTATPEEAVDGRRAAVEVGFAPGATDGRDAHDVAAPPPHFETFGLRVAPAEGRPALAADYRAEAARAAFDLVLRAAPGRRVRLVAEGLDAERLDAIRAPEVQLVDLAVGRAYDLRAGAAMLEPATIESRYRLVLGTAADVARAQAEAVPERVIFAGAYPNPFREYVALEYAVPEAVAVRIVVYDVLGRRVRLLADGLQPAGFHRLAWDGTGDAGTALASGVYLVRLDAGGAVRTRRLVLTR